MTAIGSLSGTGITPNEAWAKSCRARPVPVDELLVLTRDTYWFEREECLPARQCDFVLVNLFHKPLGAPMWPGDERPIRDVPGLPALRREEIQDHEPER
jgi:hypothetical protein